MGVMMAPVVGSGSTPAWMALVPNFMNAKVALVARKVPHWMVPLYTKPAWQSLRIQ